MDYMCCDAVSRWRSKGVVGAAVAVSHMPQTEAMAHVTFLLDSSANFSTEAKGLLYDELADTARDLDNLELVEGIKDQVMNNWEETYVMNLAEAESLGKVCYQLDLAESPVAIPLMPGSAQGQLQVMCSHLRLCLVLVQRLDLVDSVDALLCAPVILPDLEDFDTMLPAEQKNALDSLFHCLNLFRELINGFSKDNSRLAQLVSRLEHVVELGEEIGRRVAAVPDYTPPQCLFFAPTKPPTLAKPKANKKSKAKKKTKKKAADKSDTSLGSVRDSSDTTEADSDATSVTKVVDISLYREFVRPLDTNIAILIKCKLAIDDVNQTAQADNIWPTISPIIGKFILEEFLLKLNSIFKRKHNPFGRPASGPTMNQHDTHASFIYCMRLVPNMTRKLEKLGNHCASVVEDCDGVYDAMPLFAPGMAEVKTCHTLLIKCLLALLSWPDLTTVRFKDTLNNLLKRLGTRTEGQSGGNQWKETFAWFVKQAEGVLHLPGAVALLQVLQALNTIRPAEHWLEEINALSLSFLSRRWTNEKGEPSSGAEYNADVKAMFVVFINTLPKVGSLGKVARLIGDVEAEAEELKKSDDHLGSFVCITKSNFVIAYRMLFSALIRGARGAKTVEDWISIAKSLSGLSRIMKKHPTKPILIAYARHCLEMLQLYVSHGLPMISLEAKRQPAQFQQAVSGMQDCTRIVQQFVCDAKSSKDVVLVKHVPKLRLLCEKVIMGVKAALIFVPGAFSTGVLKNRNLKGDEVLSQPMDEEEEEEPAGDDSEPEDSADEADKSDADDASECSTTL